ncbi:hypothetical protein QBC43DRAFT_218682 [Cladorrhinum sp. PSN259]|nr:hypothetical protein QBC43DRAFT_218682 [Cladorrhinum sp. PSN259]
MSTSTKSTGPLTVSTAPSVLSEVEEDPIIEFYLASLWIYTPKAVKRVIDTLNSLECPNSEVIFQTEWNWFRVISHQSDCKPIRFRFYRLTKEIVQDAFHGDYSPMLGEDGTLHYGGVDNEWIIGVNEVISIKRIRAKNYDAYRYPATLGNYYYKDVWEEGNGDGQVVKLDDFLPEALRLELEHEHNVTLTHDLTGNTIYIGGHDQASVSNVRARLRVLLSAKTIEFSAGRFEHLLYAEHWDYQDCPFTADMRYMTNIDPRLSSSTLIDSGKVRNLEAAYERLYKIGVSIRLCEFSMWKNRYVSTFGPSIRPREDKKQNHVLGNRPVVSNKKKERVDVQDGSDHDGKSGIAAWIANIPDTASLASPSQGLAAGPSFDTEQEALDYYSWLTADAAADEKLIDVDPPTIRELVRIESPRMTSVSVLSLAPPRTSLTLTLTLAAKNTGGFKRYNDPGVQKHQTMKQQGGNRNTDHPHLLDLDEAIPGWMPEKGFFRDLEAALQRLLVGSPFRSGILELRAEFGRAILGEVDETALSFNAVNTKSDGWKKWDILNKLNVLAVVNPMEQRNRIHFTKILTTSSADVEDIINLENIWNQGRRFWTPKPASAWTVYSFRCILEADGKSCQFVVEIEDHGPASKSPRHMRTMIKPVHPAHDADGVTPLYVHAIRCNWDLRFMLMHIDCKKMESLFGEFASRLFRGLEITWNDGPDLKFSIPTGLINVKNVRVLTKWRHLSPDLKSALEITEVERLEMKQLSWQTSNPRGMLQKDYHARPFSLEKSKKLKANGDPTRWYEAAVVSTMIEDVFKENAVIASGEKANWEVPTLAAMKAFPPLYEPVLNMVRLMDRIGGDNDNGHGKKLWDTVARKNDTVPAVPGLTEPSSLPWKSTESPEKNKKDDDANKHVDDGGEFKFF